MIQKGQKYIKRINGLEFVVVEVTEDEVHISELCYFAVRVMSYNDFIKNFELKKSENEEAI